MSRRRAHHPTGKASGPMRPPRTTTRLALHRYLTAQNSRQHSRAGFKRVLFIAGRRRAHISKSTHEAKQAARGSMRADAHARAAGCAHCACAALRSNHHATPPLATLSAHGGGPTRRRREQVAAASVNLGRRGSGNLGAPPPQRQPCPAAAASQRVGVGAVVPVAHALAPQRLVVSRQFVLQEVGPQAPAERAQAARLHLGRAREADHLAVVAEVRQHEAQQAQRVHLVRDLQAAVGEQQRSKRQQDWQVREQADAMARASKQEK